jgi:hypothetical protein
LLALLALLLVYSSKGHAQQQTMDSDAYHRAAEYCRGIASGSMTLSPERDILCFDGWSQGQAGISLAKDLRESGLFVVRSAGNAARAAIALSDLLRRRNATVVVYDYCLEDCASYFFFASMQTYVIKGTLVAWSDSATHLVECGYATRDDGFTIAPKVHPRLPCPDSILDIDLTRYKANSNADVLFYLPRAVHPSNRVLRDSPYVTALLWKTYNETGVYLDALRTLTPKLQNIFKTRIRYEAYPANQAEVDAIANGVRIKFPVKKVIYDP